MEISLVKKPKDTGKNHQNFSSSDSENSFFSEDLAEEGSSTKSHRF